MKITTNKPATWYPTILSSETQGVHPMPNDKPFIRRVRSTCVHDFDGLTCRKCEYYASPVNCSKAGHDTIFNRSMGDWCRTCGVQW